jgi:hypothetical protein
MSLPPPADKGLSPFRAMSPPPPPSKRLGSSGTKLLILRLGNNELKDSGIFLNAQIDLLNAQIDLLVEESSNRKGVLEMFEECAKIVPELIF